ncbi:hypothetical protein BMETH_1412_1 [methanotrophic bacterial endosymbiont of Bathymodiolus sp.]|nr:hypothetical protein BMETH_1412_1 [methanotrophic bacterial endosymbiont of Bathymodiolus sp.]
MQPAHPVSLLPEIYVSAASASMFDSAMQTSALPRPALKTVYPAEH